MTFFLEWEAVFIHTQITLLSVPELLWWKWVRRACANSKLGVIWRTLNEHLPAFIELTNCLDKLVVQRLQFFKQWCYFSPQCFSVSAALSCPFPAEAESCVSFVSWWNAELLSLFMEEQCAEARHLIVPFLFSLFSLTDEKRELFIVCRVNLGPS